MVTVVDAGAFPRDLGRGEELRERGIGLGEEDDRTIDDLLVDQVEFADVLVVNKADRVSADELAALQALLRKLNPGAHQIVAEHGRVDPKQILATGRFDFERAVSMPGWMAELRGQESSEQDEYGIRSFVYRARRPFHPRRFHDLIEEEWPGVLRSKGFLWLATRHDIVGTWHQAGGSCTLSGAGFWWATVAPEDWPDDPVVRAEIEANSKAPFGDRRQDLVVIGRDMDEAELTRRLDACLLNDEEFALGVEGWQEFEDDLASWLPEEFDADGPESGDPESGDPESGDPESGDPESGDPEFGDPEFGDAGVAGPDLRSAEVEFPSVVDPGPGSAD